MNIRKVNQKFGLVAGGACLLMVAWQYFVHYHAIVWLLAIGILLMLSALIIPQILNPLRLVWDRIGHVLAVINTAIILFLLYFLIITPVGVIMRLFGKNGLDLKFERSAATYWKPVKTTGQSSMKQQF
ncbi:SxtJ family membrane protein [Mucilaginibacter sp. 3215]|uniref:SxtJ family membrane protein n=1 Tax=Mucilaginibacter sp. 3215 TaxID=3373912 RepID=UPI003D231EB2